MKKVALIDFPRFEDRRGNLTPLEAGREVPFPVARAYWIYEVPGGGRRGGHAYHTLEEVFIALSGSFDVILDDGRAERVESLNRSYTGLYVPPLIWRRLENFSTNAVCLILASRRYDSDDYMYSRDEFLTTIGAA
jgi:oxalate decarboxylase/phosphoglucose isomerase-like protein (cupin superfamily)